MFDDLRIGLVEAATDAILDVVYLGASRAELGVTQIKMHELAAEAAVDRMLGFLTDNAAEWADAIPRSHWSESWPRALIAALADSRDTGEKP